MDISKYKIKKIISLIVCMIILANSNVVRVYATEGDENEVEEDPIIVVSLGDSYSSGEGIEPFYEQDKDTKDKVKEPDWLAHRSELSWSGKLVLSGMQENTTLKDYRVKVDIDGNLVDYEEGKDFYWFFVASSGAETVHFNDKKQDKEYDRDGISGSKPLKKQLDIFDNFDDNTVDYVTLTIGGNDVKFAEIITKAAMSSSYINPNGLTDKLNGIWDSFYEDGGTEDKIRQAYIDISDKAGKNARIIVAGYPTLLEQTGKGMFFSQAESQLINHDVHLFNLAISAIVDESRDDGINVYFVSVEEEFNGHEAYSGDDNAFINKVIIIPKSQDLTGSPPSAYSMHPNDKGAVAYATCVQRKIDELESEEEPEKESESNSDDQDDSLISDAQEKVEEEVEKKKREAEEWLWKKIEEKLNEWLAENCGGC